MSQHNELVYSVHLRPLIFSPSSLAICRFHAIFALHQKSKIVINTENCNSCRSPCPQNNAGIGISRVISRIYPIYVGWNLGWPQEIPLLAIGARPSAKYLVGLGLRVAIGNWCKIVLLLRESVMGRDWHVWCAVHLMRLQSVPLVASTCEH